MRSYKVPIPPGQSKAPPFGMEEEAGLVTARKHHLVLIVTPCLNPLPARLLSVTSLSPRSNVGMHVAIRLSTVNRGGSSGGARGAQALLPPLRQWSPP